MNNKLQVYTVQDRPFKHTLAFKLIGKTVVVEFWLTLTIEKIKIVHFRPLVYPCMLIKLMDTQAKD